MQAGQEALLSDCLLIFWKTITAKHKGLWVERDRFSSGFLIYLNTTLYAQVAPCSIGEDVLIRRGSSSLTGFFVLPEILINFIFNHHLYVLFDVCNNLPLPTLSKKIGSMND